MTGTKQAWKEQDKKKYKKRINEEHKRDTVGSSVDLSALTKTSSMLWAPSVPTPSSDAVGICLIGV